MTKNVGVYEKGIEVLNRLQLVDEIKGVDKKVRENHWMADVYDIIFSSIKDLNFDSSERRFKKKSTECEDLEPKLLE